MKKLLLLLAFFPLLIQAQSVKAKLGTGGSFIILNSGTPGQDEFVKLLIKETGEVNWYLDGQDLFIRDGFFDAFGTGTLYKYDFMHIDGVNGRIGFNILNGFSDGSPGGEDNLPLTSSVTLMGSIATKIRLLSGISNYVIQQDDHIMIIDKTDNTNSDMVLTPVATSRGREYIFKRNDNATGKIIVRPAPGEKLNGQVDGSVTLVADNSTLEVVCGADSWWVISEIDAAQLPFVTTTLTAYTLNKRDNTILADASSASFTVTLPGAATVEAGKTYTVKRTNAGANTVIVDGNGSETIDGIPSLRLNQRFDYLQLQSDGTNWMVISERISPSLVVNPTLPYAATVYDGTISSDGNGTINLPSAAAVLGGKIFTIKNSATAGNPTLTVDPNGSETVDGLATWPLLKGQFVTIQSDGTNWIVIGQ
ncbi:MAG TPA: hypothetical protein VHQ93_20855 [Chitinophagaceae bacterium]|nr:hypothetical protein [Chitinophagaceae bacterium]